MMELINSFSDLFFRLFIICPRKLMTSTKVLVWLCKEFSMICNSGYSGLPMYNAFVLFSSKLLKSVARNKPKFPLRCN